MCFVTLAVLTPALNRPAPFWRKTRFAWNCHSPPLPFLACALPVGCYRPKARRLVRSRRWFQKESPRDEACRELPVEREVLVPKRPVAPDRQEKNAAPDSTKKANTR